MKTYTATDGSRIELTYRNDILIAQYFANDKATDPYATIRTRGTESNEIISTMRQAKEQSAS